MPDSWNSERYKERAKAWRDRAASLPEGSPERDACVMLAEGYEKLAALIETRRCVTQPAGAQDRAAAMKRAAPASRGGESNGVSETG